ncbi:MAG: CHAT domain-containing protein [Chloroflexales bacterium]|nr:CHAT domain-containing protein [Chloroflexales bacterium]
MLSASLFADQRVRQAFLRACDIAEGAGRGLRVCLRFDPEAQALASLRWETLRDPRYGGRLFTSERIILSRYVESPIPAPLDLQAVGTLSALLVIAAPDDLARYNLIPIDSAAVAAQARGALQGASLYVLSRSSNTPAVSLAAMMLALHEGYDLLYLVAHGRIIGKKAYVCLERADGQSTWVADHQIIQAVTDLARRPALVILSTCFSAGMPDVAAPMVLAPQLARSGIAAVIGMQGPISSETAALFTTTLLRELLRDGVVDRAMAVARSAILERPDWWQPALFLRSSDGQIFVKPAALEPGQTRVLLLPLAGCGDSAGGRFDQELYSQLEMRCEALRVSWPPRCPKLVRVPDRAATVEEVRKVGLRHSAALVVWGLRDDTGVALAVEMVGAGAGELWPGEGWPVLGPATGRLPLAAAAGNLTSAAAYLATLVLGLLLIQQGQLTQARKLLDLALATALASPWGNSAAATVHYWRGMVGWVTGEVAGALADFDRALELRPSWPCAEAQRGVVLLRLGGADAAQEAFAAAIAELGPGEQQARAALLGNLGLARLAQGQPEAALSALHEALAIEEASGTLGGQARQLLRIGEIERARRAPQALQLFERAAQLFQSIGAERGLALALAGKAQTLAQEGQVVAARTGYEEAMVILERLGARAEVAAVREQLRTLG